MGKILDKLVEELGEIEGKSEYQKFLDKQNNYNRNSKLGRAHYLASRYRSSDRYYNRENNVTPNFILNEVLNGRCIYCNEDNWRCLGLDRIDNSKGHVTDNVVCCCGNCNIKRGRKPFASFYRTMQGQKKQIA
jgi:hypothetical protein